MLDVFTITSPALPKGTRVVGFRGSEGISRLYAFEIHLTLSPDASDDFDLAAATGAAASLVLDRQDGRPPFAFHGIFSECALVHHQPDGRALLRALLVPRLWRLTQTYHSRIFTQEALPDILKKTLEDGGLTSDDYSLQLSRSYPPEEHVCQYRESHFDFISRWMEREGLYYWFEQGDVAEKLVIADSKSVHEDLAPAPIRFFALSGADHSAGECLHTFVCRHRALPASVRYKDHDYTKPKLDVSGSAPVSKSGHGEISVYGARFFTPDAGQRLAQLRAEELLAREQVFTGSGTAFHLRAGYTFTLQDHPRGSFDTRYLVTEVEHHGNQSASTPELRHLTGLASDEVYRVDVTAIAHTVQFRAEQRTPWPRIYGTEHGTVDGEADSEYAQLDDQGRYLVRFAFDESDLGDGKASTRVRMMQPHGGDVEGWHFPLRKGTEVLFTFLGGDPDRPVIAGVVPNAMTPSPINKANHTRNVIQTGGRNRLEMEDKAGFQRVTLSTPYANTMIRIGAPNGAPMPEHEMILKTDGDAHLDCENWDIVVHDTMDQEVMEDWKVQVHGKQDEVVTGTSTIEIGQDYRRTCHASAFLTIDSNEIHSVGANRFVKTGANEVHSVGGEVVETVGGNATLTVAGKLNQVVGGSVSLTSGAAVTVTSASQLTLQAPSVKIKSDGDWIKKSAFTLELYTSKNGIGDTKREITASAFAVTGTKTDITGKKYDTTGLKVDLTGIKIDNNPIAKQTIGQETKVAAIKDENTGASLGKRGVLVESAALAKIG